VQPVEEPAEEEEAVDDSESQSSKKMKVEGDYQVVQIG